MQSIDNHYDALIVGAGPAGIVSANLLGQFGVKVLLIDKSKEILEIPRAVGMCDEGSRVVNSAGFDKEFDEQVLPIKDLYFFSKEGKAKFRVDCERKINGFQMLRTIQQPDLERMFRKGVKRYSNVDFINECELVNFKDEGNKVYCQLDLLSGEEKEQVDVSCEYLLACDGASSSIRKALNIEFGGQTYKQDWVVIDVDKDPEPEGEPVYFICDTDRPGVTLPTPNRTRRWEFVMKKGETEEDICSLESLRKLLSPWGNVDEMTVSRKTAYTFHALLADHFSKGRVFLLGDAAHLTPPFAGQGLMAGLRDAGNLAWKIAYVVQKKLPESILDSYHKERKPQAAIIIFVAKFMGVLVLPQSKIAGFLRDFSFFMFRALSFNLNLNRAASLQKAPNSTLGFSAIWRWFRDTDKISKGFEFPYAMLERESGEVKPIDEYINGEFTIISSKENIKGFLGSENQARFENLGGKFCVIGESFMDSSDDYVLKDTHDFFVKQLAGKNEVVLVRPDRFVELACSKSNLNKYLSEYFKNIGLDEGSSLSLSDGVS